MDTDKPPPLEIKAFFFFISNFRLLKLSNPHFAFSGSTIGRLACSNAHLTTRLWMSDIALQSFCKLASLFFPLNDATLMKIHVAGSEVWPWNPPSLVAFECFHPKGWEKRREIFSRIATQTPQDLREDEWIVKIHLKS
jgi:hypothetical protein